MLELYTFSVSHFSEKARWLLDAAGIEYREVRWTPFFHVLPALRRGRFATTVPILRHRHGHVQDSTAILLWLDANMPGFNLLPRQAGPRADVLALEERCDRAGAHVIRYAYSALLDDEATVVEAWTLDANRLERTVIARGYPVFQRAFRALFGVDERRVARSRQVIAETLDALDARLGDGREYLVGSTLSAADITACALLAPLFGPDEHPVYCRPALRGAMRPLVAEWQERPVAAWLRRRYREDRHKRSG